ncbi:MAG: WD40/YVTN/BNR-like repeat-containing protein, partial [Bacteroidia bacterium]
AGDNWSTYQNQPTAQFYRVTTDNHFPYRIYVAQQDNSTVRIPHRTAGRSIGERDWERTAGGESAHIAPDPDDPDIVYGGSYGGFLTRKNHKTNETRGINVWPDNPMGHGAEGMKYRFQWNFPIFFSPHDGDKLYACSQHLHVSTDEGQSWKTISPDLTRNDSAKLVSSGGIITQDNTGVEYYCTIFAAAESQHEAGVIWAGSDDGLLHITRDGGANWENVTPPKMPEWTQINSIEIDPHEKGGLYVAATSYKSGDYHPYLYKTKDYGKRWELITEGIDEAHFTRVIRADPVQKGLLYAGTESGLYMSMNDGESWQQAQLNLPIVPVTDLVLKNNNLIVATQGRSIWVLDDVTVLHQAMNASGNAAKLFAPMPSYRMPGGAAWRPSLLTGKNHPGGVNIHYYFPQVPDSNMQVSIIITEKDGTEIRRFSTQSKEKSNKLKMPKKGLNTFNWNMRYPSAKKVKGMILWWASLEGPKALPGTYNVRMEWNEKEKTEPFEILANPQSSATASDMKAQFDFLTKNRDKLTETHEAILEMRSLRKQLGTWKGRAGKDSTYTEVSKMAKRLMGDLKKMEETLYQTKSRSPQDPLNFPIRLNNKLGHVGSLSSMGDFPPTDQAIEVQTILIAEIDKTLADWRKLLDEEVPVFNALVNKLALPALQIDN